MLQENYQLNLIKWHQEVRLQVLVRETYVFSIFFETARLPNFLILKQVLWKENQKDLCWKVFICVQKMCVIICIMMYVLCHWPQLAYGTLYLLWSFEIGWCENVHQNRY